MRVDSTRPRGAPSGAVPPPPISTGADATVADVDVPPPTTSDDLDIRHTLDSNGLWTDFGGRAQ